MRAALCFFAFACLIAAVHGQYTVAIAYLFGTTNCPACTATVKFQDNGVSWNVNVVGSGFAPNSVHGIHVHQYGDLSQPNGGTVTPASGMGGHFDPYGTGVHACPADTFGHHAGDMGSITATGTGTLNVNIALEKNLTFHFDSFSAIGRGVVIHQLQDDCTNNNLGNAGTRYAQGTIGRATNVDTIDAASSYGAGNEASLVLSAKLFTTAMIPTGQVWMRQSPTNPTKVQVYLRLDGIEPGSIHGIHVHQYGDMSNNFNAAGGHWNPLNQTHHVPYEAGVGERHIGDMGNVIADRYGSVYHMADYDTLKMTDDSPNMVGAIGLGFLVHAWPDLGVLGSSANGASGGRFAMGVLGVAAPDQFPLVIQQAGVSSVFAKLLPTANAPGTPSGWVHIEHSRDSMANITVSLTGLAASTVYAIHIHEFGDLTSPSNDGTATGGHFNPFNFPHNCSNAAMRHAGDIGNLMATDASGNLYQNLQRDWITLFGVNSTVGRGIVVHAQSDNCAGTTGNAGARWLQGVLGIENRFLQNATNPGLYPAAPPQLLIASMSSTSGSTGITGYVMIAQDPNVPTNTLVYVELSGVTQGYHGIHVHTWGDWSFADGNNAGGHWNPTGVQHYLPVEAGNRHAGDLGNILVRPDGTYKGYFVQKNNLMPWRETIGRAVILHASNDGGNAANNQNGNAGTRIAMGVIGIANPTKTFPQANSPPTAIAKLFGTSSCPSPYTCSAVVSFIPFGYQWRVQVTGSGWQPRTVHAIHVHEFGDMSQPNGGTFTPVASGMGGHFDPTGSGVHACPGFPINRHAGDMGNITVQADGSINSIIDLDALYGFAFSLIDENALGRGVVIHALGDDCSNTNLGNAGARLAQGTIGRAFGVAVADASTQFGATDLSVVVLSAKLFVNGNGAPFGQVWMRQSLTDSTKTQVYVKLVDLQPGAIHGIHIHEFGDMTSTDSSKAGGHWNPFNEYHRLPYESSSRHVGDMGNVVADRYGKVYHMFEIDHLAVADDTVNMASFIGLGVVVHAWPDLGVLGSFTNGASGPRYGMGVVGIAADTEFPTSVEWAGIHSTHAKLFPTSTAAGTPSGWVHIENARDGKANITVSLTGMAANTVYAMHIHEFGDLTSTNNDGMGTGGHYNPWGFPHNCSQAGMRHAGDIGNLMATNAQGSLYQVLQRDWIVMTGVNSTIGRGIVVHQQADNCMGATGNAGGRWLQGVLGVENRGTLQNSSNPGTYPLPPATPRVLIATMSQTTDSPTVITGTVMFAQDPNVPSTTLVYVDMAGIQPVGSNHGFHVHTYGDWSFSNGVNAGAHWNPNNAQHNLPQNSPNRHAGDMGNILVKDDGTFRGLLTTQTNNLMPLIDLIGRAVILHQFDDEGPATQTGNAGARYAMGVIGVANPSKVFPYPSMSTGGQGSNSTASTGGCLSVDGNCGNTATRAAGGSGSFMLSAGVAIAVLVATRRLF